MHPWSNATLFVPRIHGKIALEEHVGTSIWANYKITPPGNQITGLGPLPFLGVRDDQISFIRYVC
jgi:hypothetical protein